MKEIEFLLKKYGLDIESWTDKDEFVKAIEKYVIKARIENSKYLLSVVWSKLKQTDCLEDYFFTAKEILDIFEERIAGLKKRSEEVKNND